MPSSSSTTRSMLRKQSPTSTGLRWVVAASESAGAKRAAEVVTQVVAVVLPGAKTASIVASLVTCLASARSPRNLVVVAAVVAETASTVTSLVIRPESARSQRNPESLVVAVALAVAETASTAASPDTCPGSARNPRSLERPGDLEADQVGATESAPEE